MQHAPICLQAIPLLAEKIAPIAHNQGGNGVTCGLFFIFRKRKQINVMRDTPVRGKVFPFNYHVRYLGK